MAFPADPLDVEVSLALSADLSDPGSWSWTDITDYVRENRRIQIRRGRSSERSTIPPSRCTLTVDNTDGRFCRLLPTGAWYGQIGKNTPLRVRVDNGSGYVTRFIGYVSGWPPSWDPSESDQTVSLTADGILRRLGQGRVLRPALERAILADGPSQFWPMNDGSDSTRPASALSGGVAMSPHSGTLDFAAADGPAGAPGPLLDMSAGALTVAFPTVGGTGYTIEFIARLTTAADPSDLIFRMKFAGSVNTMSEDADFIPNDGQWHHYLLAESQVGADVYRERWLDGELDFDATLPATTLLHPNALTVNVEPPFFSPMEIGYMAIHPHANVDAPARYQAMSGFLGEMAHERVERLCAEEGVPVTVTASESQPMGAQGNNTLVALLRECATTDFGLLYEPADAAGLAYLSSTERYNQAAAVTLQYDQGHVSPPWDPTDDDRDTRNDVTASRSGGGSARVTDAVSIAAIGLYDDTLSANTETDDQLNDVAGWAVNLGTVDELRWPAVKPNLMAHPSLIDDWMAADIGSQLHVTGHPSPLAPDDIEQIIEGYDEVFGSYEYSVTANLSPASGWRVAELDDDDLGKLDTDGSELGIAVNSSATSLTVATLNMDSPLWTTDSGEMPVPVVLAGEVVSATDIASSVRDTFAGSSSNGWGTSDSGHAWTIGAGTASLFSETSGVGRIAISALNTVHHISVNVGYAARQRVRVHNTVAVTPTGAPINWGLLLRYVDASNYYWIDVQVSTAGVLTLRAISVISSVVTQLATATSRTVHSTSVARILIAEIGDDDLIRAKVYANGSAEPTDWELTHQASTTDLQTGTRVGCIGRLMTSNTNSAPVNVDFDNFAVLNPQVMTVTRGVNGVSKSQTAGTAVNVHRPARLAL